MMSRPHEEGPIFCEKFLFKLKLKKLKELKNRGKLVALRKEREKRAEDRRIRFAQWNRRQQLRMRLKRGGNLEKIMNGGRRRRNLSDIDSRTTTKFGAFDEREKVKERDIDVINCRRTKGVSSELNYCVGSVSESFFSEEIQHA